MAAKNATQTIGLLPRVLTAQFGAFLLILIVGWSIAAFAVPPVQPPTWLIASVQGVAAAGLSRLLGLRQWWLGAQFLLPVLAWSGLAFEVPPWVFLAAFGALFLVYSNTSKEQVPLYLTNRTTWAALSELLAEELHQKPEGEQLRFVDLGCGLGGTIAYLAKAHPDWKFTGVENAPGPYLFSKLRLLGCGNANVQFKSLWDVNLSDYDVAYAFLSPAPMPRLIEQGEQQMKEGALLISNSFWAPDKPFDSEAEVNDGRKSRLFLKRISKK